MLYFTFRLFGGFNVKMLKSVNFRIDNSPKPLYYILSLGYLSYMYGATVQM